jgi:zinc finger protein 830
MPADVRSLLRSERASRRITHPCAVYSKSGSLSCAVCHLQIKSENLWDLHLKSPQHIALFKRAQSQSSNDVPKSRKRKAADDDEEEEEDLRKRVKSATHQNAATNEVDVPEEGPAEVSSSTTPPTTLEIPSRPASTKPILEPSVPPPPPTTAIDEDEWAAFERDVATPPPSLPAPSALAASATIVAAPLTAAEIAAKSRGEASIQAKERREAEIEGEKEDAARRLEEEFDDMEELEARVRRLREKREAIRKKREDGASGVEMELDRNGQAEDPPGDADEEEDDELEDLDDWDFG